MVLSPSPTTGEFVLIGLAFIALNLFVGILMWIAAIKGGAVGAIAEEADKAIRAARSEAAPSQHHQNQEIKP